MSLLESLRLTPTAAMRQANPALQSSGSLAGDADALRREVAGRSKDAISFASTLGQRDRKLALATALQDIDLQRQAADRLVDPGGRSAAYKQILSRIEVALNVARKPGLLEHLPPETATTAADKQPAPASAAKGMAKPSGSAPAPAADRRAIDGDVAKGMERARALLATIDDPKRKAALADALEVAQKQSAAAGRLTEPGARELALRQAMDRVQAAVLGAEGQDAEASRVPQRRSTQELARNCRPAIVGAQADEQKRYREVSEAIEAWKTKAAAKGPAQADAKKRQAALELELKGVQANLKQLDADLTAIESPSTTDATLHAVLARHQSAAVQRGQAGRGRTTVDSYGDPNDVDGAQKATTITDYNKGVALTHEIQRSVRLDDKGLTVSDGSTTTRSTATNTITRSQSTTGTVDGDGLRVERSKKIETETDGLKEGREQKTGVKVDTKSATMSTTTTVNREDGSSSESTKSISVERGDGKAGLAGSFGKTHQGEDESKKSHVVNVKGGVSAGKDGIGAYGQADLTLDKTTAKGGKVGLVPGLAPNIVCNVVPRNSTPETYDVLLRVELGISVTAKGGYDKDPGKDSSGKARPDDSARATAEANLSASHKVTMESKRHLTGPQLDAYLAALKTGGGTDKEFAVIKAGLTKGWDFARDVYLGVSGKAMDVAEANKLAVGESTKVASETKGGAGVGLGTKGGGVGVGAEFGYERGSTTSTSVTKGADGKLIYDKQQGDSGKISYGGKVKAGAVEGGLSIGNLETTSTGYEIVIDPQDKRADKLQKELAACKSQADLDAFVARYGKAVVKSKTKGTAKAETLDVSAGIGDAAKGKLSFGHGVAESQTTDAEGNLVEKSVTGTSDSGAEFTVLGKKIGASSKAQLAATTDAQGHASADLSKTDTAPDVAKWLASNVPLSGDKDKSQGVLGKATGAPPDTDQTTVSGVKLSESDLKNLGLLAAEDWKGWMDSCVSGDDRKEWATVGRRIQKAPEKQRGAVAATELARFVGASSRERNQIVASALGRRAGRVGAGTGYQFPGALAKWKDEYLQLVAPPVAALVARLLEGKDPTAALDVGAPTLKRLDEMHRAFEMSADFESPALRAEMLGAIVARKTELRVSLRTAVAGPPTAKDELDDKKARYNDLLSNCINFQADEQKTFTKVDELVKDGGHHAIEITKLLNELKTVYAVWDKDYAQMSRLAEDNKFGSSNYWAYRPDIARFDKAHKFEAPGLASQVKKPPKGKAAPELTDEQLNEQANTNNDLISKGVKDAQAIERQLQGARARAMALSNKLQPLVEDRKKAAAVKLYDQAYDLFTSGEKAAARIKPHDMKDLNSYGTQALQDYNAAAAGLTKALAMFTKA